MTEKVPAVKKQPVKPQRAKPRPTVIIAILVILIVALCWGLYWWSTARWMEDTDDAYVRADIVTLAPRINGYLTKVAVQDNQRVTQGELLAKVDTRDYQAKVDKALAAIDAASAQQRVQQARITGLQARAIQQRSRIDDAKASVNLTAAEAEQASAEWQRQRRLAVQHVSSAQQVEVATSRMKATAAEWVRSKARLTASELSVQIINSDLQGAEAEKDKAEAALSQAQAGLSSARIDLESTQIRSPINGTVGQRTIRPGEYVDVGEPLLAVVPDDVYIVANFKETQVDGMQTGQPVEVVADALAGRHFRAKVASFAPSSGAQFALLPPDNATGNFTKIVQRMPVKIQLEPGQQDIDRLKPGMSVVVKVDTHHD